MNDLNLDTCEKTMLSNANTKPKGGKDLKILDIIHSLENPRLRLGFFQTIYDIENTQISKKDDFWNPSKSKIEISALTFLVLFPLIISISSLVNSPR